METLTNNFLKYNIKTRLYELEESKRLRIKRKVFERCSKMSNSTFSRYINARDNDTIDIPGEVLKVFADLLHVEISDLYNY